MCCAALLDRLIFLMYVLVWTRLNRFSCVLCMVSYSLAVLLKTYSNIINLQFFVYCHHFLHHNISNVPVTKIRT